MQYRKYILSQSATMLAGQLLGSSATLTLSAVLDHFDAGVLLGTLAGSLLATLNHAVLVTGVLAAAAKAEKQDTEGAEAVIRFSYLGRLTGLILILLACALSERFNLLALVTPLLLSRPILAASGRFFRQKGGAAL